ncbi:MAG TPA: hypothetical protein VNZ57_16035 [Longimicrobiales bacterium]|nr:hypothetical protein [Longimicrobiales bacterium]
MDEQRSQEPRHDGAGNRDAVLGALARYRQVERKRSAAKECLVEAATRPGGVGHGGRRREELLERMVRQGVSVELAADAYDIAVDEGVDPAFALEVVRCGIGVVETESPDQEAAPTVESWPGEWIGPSPAPAAARREKLLRTTFRRLRRLLSEHPTPESALIAFADEPDVRACEY